MKINGPQPNAVTQVYLGKVNKAAQSAATDGVKGTDKVELSADVEAIQSAKQAIADAPAVREDKVEALRKQIEQGTYQVPAEKIADKMLSEMRLSKLSDK